MATFEPDIDLFRTQIDSLRAQTDADWICLISDDCSSPERFDEIERDGRRRRALRRLALAAEPGLLPQLRAGARADPGRGASSWRCAIRTIAGIPRSCGRCAARSAPRSSSTRTSAWSTATGACCATTLWSGRRNNHTNLASLLIANTHHRRRDAVSPRGRRAGAPLPRHPRLAVPRPLARPGGAGERETSPTSTARSTTTCSTAGRSSDRRPGRRPLRPVGARSPEGVRCAAGGRPTSTAISRARCWRRRCSPAAPAQLPAAKRRALERFVAAARQPLAFAWLAARPLRRLRGRQRDARHRDRARARDRCGDT